MRTTRTLTLATAATLFGATAASLAGAAPAVAAGPPVSVSAETVRGALTCRSAPAPRPLRRPVLLVPGVEGTAEESFSGGLLDALPAKGLDACALTVPESSRRSLAPAAEWVVAAVRELDRRSGVGVDVVSHSQGALMTRWATRWWPDVGALVDDHVSLAGPIASSERRSSAGVAAGPRTLAALNRPGLLAPSMDGTAITTDQDEVVQPASSAQYPEELENAASISVQEVCPGRVVDHRGLLFDAAVRALVLDALLRPGPAAAGAVAGSCASAPPPTAAFAGLGALLGGGGAAPSEPPLPDYVASSPDRFGELALELRPSRLTRTRLKRALRFVVRVGDRPLRRATVTFGDDELETNERGEARMNYKPTRTTTRTVKAVLEGYSPARATLRVVKPKRR